MAILVDESTKLVVQGLTGREGTFHSLRNRDYGTQVVAGTSPKKDRKSTRLNSSHVTTSRMPSSA